MTVTGQIVVDTGMVLVTRIVLPPTGQLVTLAEQEMIVFV